MSTRSERRPNMAICNCPLDAHSLTELCARCVGEYLNLCAQAQIEDRTARLSSDSETDPITESKAYGRAQGCSRDGEAAAALRDVRTVEEQMPIIMSRARGALEAHENRITEQGKRIEAIETVVCGLLRLAKGHAT